MKIAFDKEYQELRLQLLTTIQEIEVKERIRYWWLRVSGWLFYRIAYGYVRTDDIAALLDKVKSVVPLTDEEIEGYRVIAEAVLGIVRREYVPTPSQLATLAEYMTIPQDIIEMSFEERKIPEKLRPFWRRYIELRPLSDDFRALFSAYFRAKRYGVAIPKELEDKIQSYFEYFNVTDKEKELRDLATQLEILIAESREYIPTPSMLATMSEYITIPEDLIDKVFKARRVPPEWQGIWRRYIAVRPLSDDVRSLMYAYLRVIRYGYALPKELEDRIKSILSEYGVSEKELEIRGLAVALEAMRETIPTLGTLASMAEYIEIPLDYVRKVLEVRRVERTFAQLWVRYVYARMISSEVNAVVSQYRRIYEYFFVPQEVAKKIEEFLTTGRMRKYDEALRSVPEGVAELLKLPGLGPRTVAKLVEMGIDDPGALRRALTEGRAFPGLKVRWDEVKEALGLK